jgi:predicted GNAT family N-acyltransferase
MRRYVYIHGSPDTVAMGTPGSIGCVRMRNSEIIELFETVPVLTQVDIDDFDVSGGDWDQQEAYAMPLREAVFVAEQGVPPEMERDEFDATSYHVVARDSEKQVIGTGRLLPDGHIGRMAVVAHWRGCGVGRALMDALIDQARRLRYMQLKLNAQTSALGFYRQFAFCEIGPEFMEAGILHRAMVRDLVRA